MPEEVRFRSDMTIKLIDSMGGDDRIVQAMLVSTQGADAQDAEASFGRINFLMKNRHGTPFEHAAMTFYAEVPIFVFREWHRHRIGVSYNEQSGRYSQLPPIYYVPGPDRAVKQIGKPGAYEYVQDKKLLDWVVEDMKIEAERNYRTYEARLALGVAKEVARMGLGINIYSAQFFTCNPRSLMAMLSLRTKHAPPEAMFPSYPMREIEMAVEQMEAEFGKGFPLTYRAFCENGRVSP